ncbi:quinone-dependent dihydroorotate dehydrogenase [Gandjariella thermophila]|uniref:Dihydroorotate dehydrogenase (quinone) n=1 Tax=Gandjariella thermophila TaxID=1931992 RepID=A0A4D4JDX0_9PSEU|nr:quinone-dependent dihydroorotate dehydrogenase [Gandjariella thermophila]GDY32838.1 dihydroorotate dehydrogenase (quinone) [Gandjariella thermophila]
MIYKQLVRRSLFRMQGGDAEAAHEWTLDALSEICNSRAQLAALRRWYAVRSPKLERTVFGLRFPNPVGLAAGMDKNGVVLPAWAALGFGFVEIGTVTRYAQPGNPKPRLFRLPDSEAVINRMGFNNEGADALATRLRMHAHRVVPLGISIGKSKATPVAEAIEDYRYSLRTLYPYGDYFAVNVSSPNTPGLRGLQDRAALSELLEALRIDTNRLASIQGKPPKPLLVKVAPDLPDTAIRELVQVCLDRRISGVIATNTTLDRRGLAESDAAAAREQGGLSGRPLAARALEVVALISKETEGRLPIVGVGGIFGPDDAKRMFDAGASLIQVFTGFIYEGPALVRRINRALARG